MANSPVGGVGAAGSAGGVDLGQLMQQYGVSSGGDQQADLTKLVDKLKELLKGQGAEGAEHAGGAEGASKPEGSSDSKEAGGLEDLIKLLEQLLKKGKTESTGDADNVANGLGDNGDSGAM